jgi:hypothetical protein
MPVTRKQRRKDLMVHSILFDIGACCSEIAEAAARAKRDKLSRADFTAYVRNHIEELRRLMDAYESESVPVAPAVPRTRKTKAGRGAESGTPVSGGPA